MDERWDEVLVSPLLPNEEDIPTTFTVNQKETILGKVEALCLFLQQRLCDMAPYYVKERHGVGFIHSMVMDIRLVVALYGKIL